MDKVKFGVIGVKGVGRSHIKSIISSEKADLVAVADINESVGREVASNYGVKWYKDYEEMLRLEEIDAVSICTPHFLHYPMAMKAFEYEKHVLVEKPMALSVGEADEMIREAKRRRLKLGVVYQMRANPVSMEIKRIIESGRIGEIFRACVEACELRTQAYYDRDTWRGKWATEGGGALINQMIHNIDLMCWLVGRPVKVIGHIETLYHNIEVEDLASATIIFENGAQGIFQASTIDLIGTARFEICGDKGKILVEKKAKMALFDKSIRDYIASGENWITKTSLQWFDIEPKTELKKEHQPIIEDFAEAIISGREPLVTGEDGRISLEIVNAIILSSFEERAVSLPISREAYDALLKRLSKKETYRSTPKSAKT